MSNETSAIPKKIVWLASYPKSGNTWFRLFLTALLSEKTLNINDVRTDGIFSSRSIFDDITDIDSSYLLDVEVKELLPEVINNIASSFEYRPLFFKIHDAYTYNATGNPIVPSCSTQCALYFIRNPLDVAGSLANHNGTTIDEAIEMMNNNAGALSPQNGNLNTSKQFKQLLLNWSAHVESWTNLLPFQVMTIRFEDMIANPLDVFSKAIYFIGINADKKRIQKAIDESNFQKLQKQEQNKGFKENINVNSPFFRKGTVGNWENELNVNQIEAIVRRHKTIMNLFNYPTAVI